MRDLPIDPPINYATIMKEKFIDLKIRNITRAISQYGEEEDRDIYQILYEYICDNYEKYLGD